jgi:membrane-bound ClpP family serine protease
MLGTAISPLNPQGEVKVDGQIWKAQIVGGNAKEGEPIVVIGREGLVLRVKPTQQTKT